MLSTVAKAPTSCHLPDKQNGEAGAAGVLMARDKFYVWTMTQFDNSELLRLNFACVLRTKQLPKIDKRPYDVHQWQEVWDHLRNQQLVWQRSVSGFTLNDAFFTDLTPAQLEACVAWTIWKLIAQNDKVNGKQILEHGDHLVFHPHYAGFERQIHWVWDMLKDLRKHFMSTHRAGVAARRAGRYGSRAPVAFRILEWSV